MQNSKVKSLADHRLKVIGRSPQPAAVKLDYSIRSATRSVRGIIAP